MRCLIRTYKYRCHPIAVPIIAMLWIMGMLNACTKADDFYEQLSKTPQIDNTSAYAYRSAYIVGQTMVIVGKLYPDNDLTVSIGSIQATVTNIDSVKPADQDPLDRVSVLITEEMVGEGREVLFSSGGYSTRGASITVYTEGGEGSFANNLTNQLLKTFSGSTIFLHCISGKGDVYFYEVASKKLVHRKKDGTETELYDLNAPIAPINATITGFLAGGVSPDGTQLYFSATVANGFVFARIDVATGQLELLNHSAELKAPYQGPVADANLYITGVYPNNNGKVYLGMGRKTSIRPYAIASFDSSNNQIRYIFKDVDLNPYTDMPGKVLPTLSNLQGTLRFHPEENLLYLSYYTTLGNSSNIELYDLDAGVLLNANSFSQSSNITLPEANLIAPFASLNFVFAFDDAQQVYGLLPMSGRRLQTLLGQSITGSSDFPRWTVFDFENQRTYGYAPGRFRQGNYSFRASDVLLNYDEDGNLYTTANGGAYLIRTQSL